MDSVITRDGAIPVTGTRIATRSNRKGKSKTPTPKKLWEQLVGISSTKKGGDGIQELYKDHVKCEAHTFFAFFKNKDRNKSQEIMCYDSTRVTLTDGNDYIHASYVDGITNPNQYIICQCPFNGETANDFWRMISQQKIEVVALCMKSDSDEGKSFLGGSSFGDLQIKTDSKKDGSVETINVSVSGKAAHKTKVICLSNWTDDQQPPANDFPKFRDAVAAIATTKVPIVVLCHTGSTRSAIFVLFDSEAERLKTKKRIKYMERIRTMRQQRAHCFDSLELMEAAIPVLVEVAKKYKDEK